MHYPIWPFNDEPSRVGSSGDSRNCDTEYWNGDAKGIDVSVTEGCTNVQIINVHDEAIHLAAGRMVRLLYPVENVQWVKSIQTQSSQGNLGEEDCRLVTESYTT